MNPPDTYLPSAAPPSAITLWKEGLDLYCQIPTKLGAPYIMRLAPDSTSIGKVLDLVMGVKKEPQRFGRRGLETKSHPLIQTTKVGSEAQREVARMVLKKMGVI